MRLHYSKTSPYVRKVLVLLHETGLLDEVELTATGGTPLDSSAMPLDQNPLGKIPVLERPDGPAFVAELLRAFPDDITSVTVGHPTLEDVFIRMTGHALWSVEGGATR